MKIVHIETIISVGTYPRTDHWKRTKNELYAAIKDVDWPRGSGKFTIYPESGKKRGKGNGVTPIKLGLISYLTGTGWKAEEPLRIAARKNPGKIDAVLYSKYGAIALEWETGNISSSHRALNKICLGLIKKLLVGGILVVPSREFYQYLTDRVGNWDEIEPYIDVWKGIRCKNGVLEIVVVEHDATSKKVPRIRKGTAGRALA